MIYLMSDVHGYSGRFYEMLEKISFGKEDTLYLLGDAVAKGPDSLGILRFLMDHGNIRFLRGNHEQRLLQYFGKAEPQAPRIAYEVMQPWILGDGNPAIRQLLSCSGQEREAVLSFLGKTPLACSMVHGGRRYLLVHGAAVCGPQARQGRWQIGSCNTKSGWSEPTSGSREWLEGCDLLARFAQNLSYEVLDSRYGDLAQPNGAPDGVIVAAGHTPTFKYGKEYAGRIIRRSDKILLDCGIGQGYGLGCLCLDTEEEFYCGAARPLLLTSAHI